MKRELAKNSADYHIYYNNLTPIIYTKIVDDGIVLNIRFLIHPKKQRNIESNIYEQIIDRFRKDNIILKDSDIEEIIKDIYVNGVKEGVYECKPM